MVCLILSSSVDTMTSNHEDNFSFRQISAFFFLESECGEGADADSEETIIHALIQYDTHESKRQTGYFLFKSQILILEIKPDRKSRLVLHQIMFYLTFKLKKKYENNKPILSLFRDIRSPMCIVPTIHHHCQSQSISDLIASHKI